MFGLSKGVVVSSVSAAVAVVAIGVLAWRSMQQLPQSVPVPPVRSEAAVQPGAAQRSPAPAQPASAENSPGAQNRAAAIPSFDVVRVEPSGEAVIAGRAEPGAQVTLMVSGKPAAQARADAQGQFVMLPEALKSGAHELTLSQASPEGAAVSTQSVAVSVPARGSNDVLVALAEPEKATRILSEPKPAAAAKPELPGGATQHFAVIRSVEAESESGFFASGQSAPGARVRIYLNDAHVADATAGADGGWSLRVVRGLTAGQYAVRADVVDEAGKVTARAEVNFAYAPRIAAAATALATAAPPPVLIPPERTAPRQTEGNAARPETPAAPRPRAAVAPPAVSDAVPPEAVKEAPREQAPQVTAAAADASRVTVAGVATASVSRGDSLWRISRKMLGAGVRYTQIYDANTAQIRDPARIYPGQVLVVPLGKQAP